MLLGQNPTCLERVRGERLILPGKVIREAQKGIQEGIQAGMEHQHAKLSACSAEEQSSPKPNPVSKIKLKWHCPCQCLNTEGTKLPPLLCSIMRMQKSTSQYGLCSTTEKHRPVRGHSVDDPSFFRSNFFQPHIFHKHLFNQSGHMSLSKGIYIISAEILT